MKKILVADDEVKIGQMLQKLLEGQGYTVRAADTTDAAWALITSDPPDLLITDLKLPPTDGVTLMNQVHTQYPSLPVIMITGSHSSYIIVVKISLHDWFLIFYLGLLHYFSRIEISHSPSSIFIH